MTEKLIQKALFKNFHSHKYRFLNIYFFENESDFLSFMPNGYCYEIEIKISRSDFKADFKKVKHDIHLSNQSGNAFYVDKMGPSRIHNPSWDLCRCFPELIESIVYQSYNRTPGKEEEINIWFHSSSKIEIREVKNKKLPNKFFYAVPAGLISKSEVPDYAGLLYINEDLSVTKAKDAKFIHKDVLTMERAFNKAYYGYQELIWQRFREMKQST